MVLVDIEPDTHNRLWRYKLDKRAKTHSEAIGRLLDEAEQRDPTASY